MRLFVKFGNVEAYGEECKMYSFLNGHLLVFRSSSRFRWLLEIS